MKVLVLTHLDATNYSIAPIVRELLNRGHIVEGYGRFNDDHNIKMFRDILEIKPLAELTDEKIDLFDVIFAGLDVIDRVRKAHKYIFCYNFLFCGNLIADCGDFMFTQCDNRNLDYDEECASMAVGNPKFTKIKSWKEGKSKQFLFIDSGHYPFGEEGRKVLAQLLLNIAKEYPDYHLVIKPRFLPDDTNVTHRNDNHIYQVISREANGTIPGNLIMLREHLDMNMLIDVSDLVLCLYTTAYIDVILRGRKLIIIDGLPSEETFDQRSAAIWKKQKEVMAKSGCMCHYTKVMDALPEGFTASNERIKEVVKYPKGASERSVNIIEYMWDSFLKYNKFPCIKSYNYETFQQEDVVDESLTWEKLITKRYKNKLRFRSRFIDYVSVDIAKRPFMLFIDEFEQKGLISPYTYNELVKIIDTYKNEIWIANKDLLWTDDIDQSFVLLALFENQKYDAVKAVPESEILCSSQYHYIMGRIMYDERDYETAIEHLRTFLIETREKPYAEYFMDQTVKQVSGEFFLGLSYYRSGDLDKAYSQFEKCELLTNNGHIKAAEYIKEIESVRGKM